MNTIKTLMLSIAGALALSTAPAEAEGRLPPGVFYDGGFPAYLGDFWPKEGKYFNDDLLWYRVGPNSFFGDFWVFDLNDDATVVVRLQSTALKTPPDFAADEFLAIFDASGTICTTGFSCSNLTYNPAEPLAWLEFAPETRIPYRTSLRAENLPPGRYMLRVLAVTGPNAGKYRGKFSTL